MSELRVIPVTFGGERTTVTDYRIQHDWGQVYKFLDIDLPDVFEARFSNAPKGESVPQIGKDNMVEIPAQFFESGAPIYCYITLHDEETDGRTYYTVKTPISPSSDRTDAEPEPEEESIITQAITALNSAVDTTTQKAQEASESADRAEQAAEGVEGYAERAEAAQSASESARDIALEAKVSAQTSAATASEKASEAISSATTASQSALTAENASESASASEQMALGYAESAQESARQARDYSAVAISNANRANQSASEASQKASEAAQSASTAVQAKTDAESAKTASQTAQGLAESARDEAVSAKTGAESARDEAQEIVDSITGKVEQIDSNTTRIESLEEDRYKPYPTDTASGSIASFPDGADDIPLKSCIVRVEPVQDLHGYDSPWVAGGGKNKLLFKDEDITASKYGMELSYNATTEVITVTGTETYGSAFSIASLYQYRLPKFVAGETYTISRTQVTGNLDEKIYFQITYRRLNGQSTALVRNRTASTTFTVPNDFDIVTNIFVGVFAGVSDVNNAFKLQLESGPTATDWTPYNENICPISGRTQVNVNHSDVDMTNPATITIDLGQTIYGGKIDVLRGVMTVENVHRVINENDDFGNYGDTGFTFKSTGMKSGLAQSGLCNLAPTVSRLTDKYGVLFGANNSIIYFAQAKSVWGVNTVSGAIQWAIDHGLELVYPLAEPIEIQLDAYIIKTLLGQNNIWADTGDTEVEYRADTTLYIKRLTESDTDMVADSNIVSGQYFMVGNDLYKATVNIASGASVIVGTNATRVSLAQALNEINQ